MIRLSFDTSGTTGEPKQVTHTLDTMIANALAFNEFAGLGKQTVMYHCLPRHHMAGFLNTILCPTLAGGRVVFGPTFSAQTAGSFLQEFIGSGANTLWVTPTIAAAILRINRNTRDYTRHCGAFMRNTFCGTAPLSPRIRGQWLDAFGAPLQESYGTSEHMLVSVQSRAQAESEHNCGELLPGIRPTIAPNGELWISGTPTGDIGQYHNGRLTITGRLKDLIIRGGVNISPLQIEDTVRKLGVKDAAAVGQPDDFWGERVLLFAEGGDLAEIIGHCRWCLPKSHWPDEVFIVDKLPRNEMGKVQKAKLLNKIAA